MWLKICVLLAALAVHNSAEAVKLTPNKAVFAVAVGSHLQVNCSSSNGVEWRSEPPDAMSTDTSLNKVEGSVAGSDNISTLTFNSVQQSNEAVYWCRDSITDREVTFQLKVFSVTTQESLYEYKENAMLNCSVQDGENRTFTYTWKKGDTFVKDIKVDGKQEFVQHKNGSLEIRHPPRSFAGVYTCTAEYEENGDKHTIDVEVIYYAQPKVIPFDKSKNLVQDEKLVVECKVLGYPMPSITWFKENEEIKEEDDSRYKLRAANSYDDAEISNGKLEIASVDFDDAAEYKCMATHSMWPEFNSTQIILVRVKDKLAALWPFLGIVAEVILLCAIIFIYEKKRNKDAVIEEDTNQDGASPEKVEGVRHRGSPNNPRA